MTDTTTAHRIFGTVNIPDGAPPAAAPAAAAPAAAPASTAASAPSPAARPLAERIFGPKPAPPSTGQPGAAPATGPDGYTFSAPEGKQYDTETVGTFGKVARELGISQKSAQQVLDKMAPALEARHQQQLDTMHAQWEQQSRTDAEFGGADFADNVAQAKGVLSRYGSPALRQLLDETGLGSHPEIVRLLHRMAGAV